jgi:hypothetical protein
VHPAPTRAIAVRRRNGADAGNRTRTSRVALSCSALELRPHGGEWVESNALPHRDGVYSAATGPPVLIGIPRDGHGCRSRSRTARSTAYETARAAGPTCRRESGGGRVRARGSGRGRGPQLRRAQECAPLLLATTGALPFSGSFFSALRRVELFERFGITQLNGTLPRDRDAPSRPILSNMPRDRGQPWESESSGVATNHRGSAHPRQLRHRHVDRVARGGAGTLRRWGCAQARCELWPFPAQRIILLLLMAWSDHLILAAATAQGSRSLTRRLLDREPRSDSAPLSVRIAFDRYERESILVCYLQAFRAC